MASYGQDKWLMLSITKVLTDWRKKCPWLGFFDSIIVPVCCIFLVSCIDIRCAIGFLIWIVGVAHCWRTIIAYIHVILTSWIVISLAIILHLLILIYIQNEQMLFSKSFLLQGTMVSILKKDLFHAWSIIPNYNHHLLLYSTMMVVQLRTFECLEVYINNAWYYCWPPPEVCWKLGWNVWSFFRMSVNCI